jgi:hypothetical protein
LESKPSLPRTPTIKYPARLLEPLATPGNDRFRASGLNLITAAIVHRNTVYLNRAARQLRAQGATVPYDLLSPCSAGEHIGLTGDYVWTEANPATPFRPLREVRSMFQPLAA